MEFTFKPTETTCNQTLSSEESPWGSEDGLRFYFMVEVGFQNPEFMASDRTFPPPDAVDNHPIKAGEKLLLSDFPPQNRSNWESRIFNIDEGDLVTICLIGMNEGLPYVAGGGGSGEDDTLGQAFATGIKVFVGSVEVPVIGPLIEEGIDLAKELSQFPDCTGTVFIYKRQFTGTQLIAELIKSNRRKTLTFSKNQSLRTQFAGGDCHVPDYEVKLDIKLKSHLAITDESRDLKTYIGDREEFIPKFTFCAPEDAPIEVWAVSYDKEISFRPNFNLKLIDFYWEVLGHRISNSNGDITRQLNVRKQPNNKSASENVTVSYEVDFNKNLTVVTRGEEGAFTLTVKAFLQLSSQDPPLIIYSNHYLVEGQEMEGDENYRAYQKCVEAFWRKIRSYVLVKQRLAPGEPNIYPGTRFRELEASLENIVNTVKEMRE